MILNLNELIEKSAATALTHQRNDGAMPAGHNGPYNDPETPVRNTAHFLYLFSDLYQKTGDAQYQLACEKAIDYLSSSEATPFGHTFHCRDKVGKDKCNGLIGQAWVIEALVKASSVFNRKDFYDLAENLFLIHPWDKNVNRWKRVEIEGNILPYDTTFNHQLWFAAAGSLLNKTKIAMYRALTFLQNIASNVNLYKNGVIFHSSSMGKLIDYFKNGRKELIRELRFRNRKRKEKNKLYLKSVGYHGFNLYAFALLKKAFPDEKIWKTKTFNKLINVCNDIQFQEKLKYSEFGYIYNLSGIEIAYAMETFFDDKEKVIPWLEIQFKETFDYDSYSFSRGVQDKNTAIARIYEAARFKYNYTV